MRNTWAAMMNVTLDPVSTAVETGSNVTFIVAAQVVRVLLMLFAAPLMARGFVRFAYKRASTSPSREPIRVAD